MVLGRVPQLMADDGVKPVRHADVQRDVLPFAALVGAAHDTVVTVDPLRQEEADSALAHAVFKLREEAVGVQGECARQRVERGVYTVQLLVGAHRVGQRDGAVTERGGGSALRGEQDAHTVFSLQRVRVLSGR